MRGLWRHARRNAPWALSVRMYGNGGFLSLGDERSEHRPHVRRHDHVTQRVVQWWVVGRLDGAGVVHSRVNFGGGHLRKGVYEGRVYEGRVCEGRGWTAVTLLKALQYVVHWPVA
jgi:hypothetical protein